MKPMSKERHLFRLLQIVLGSLVLLSIGSCKELQAIDAITNDPIPMDQLKDGTYESFQDYKLVTARVSVTIKNGQIESITVLDHQHGPNHGADAIVERVIKRQNIDVDVITGATGSSKVLLKTIGEALKKARQL